MKKISVIIPAYNCENTIKRAIQSVEKQTYKNIEIIIVNDGSTDNTLKLCKQLAQNDKRIIIISTNNSGVSNARNIGIINSKGEYITFIDADDYIDTNTYEECMEIIEREKVDILKFSYIKDYGSIKKMRKYSSTINKIINKKDYDKEVYDNAFSSEDYTAIWNAIIKKNIISDIRFQTNLFYAEDFLFMMETITNSSSIYITNKPYYHYIVNSGSATLNYSPENTINRIDNILTSNTKVLYMLGKDDRYLKKYDMKIKKAFNDKLGMIANYEKYKIYKKTVETIEKLESYKTYTSLVESRSIDKRHRAYLKYKIIKKMKCLLKKVLIKGA